jgi:serine/threonine-protein kinase SRPK3
MLGEPDIIQTLGGSPPGPQAPRELVASTPYSFPSFLEENIFVIDFGQSFEMKAPPKGYQASTVIHYFPPEYRFDNVASLASDIWGLACTIFEIRAGRPLFNTYFGAHSDVMRDNVLTLGKLPEPWWSAFEEHHKWFEENGAPKFRSKRSIREKLEMIGVKDTPPEADDGPMIEAVGTRLEKKEVVLLSDLLEKMLKYRPEERITIREVVQHPWFEYTSAQ